MSQLLIYTDLDGTMLDPKDYTYDEETVNLVKFKNLPLIFCSSKTRLEQEEYQTKIGINSPMIVENGGAVFIPEEYFSFPFDYDEEIQDYKVIELGMTSTEITAVLREIRADLDLNFKGYSDMSVNEVMDITGLTMEEARKAMAREYSETIDGDFSENELKKFQEALLKREISCTPGSRFYGITSCKNDKGKAVSILNNLYNEKFKDIISVGIGDSQNDIPLLKVVDEAYLVQKPKEVWIDTEDYEINKVEGVGPEGWRQVIEKIL